MCLGVEHPFIQADNIRVRESQIQIFQDLCKVEARQLWLKQCRRLIHVHNPGIYNTLPQIHGVVQALEDLPVPVGVGLLTSEAVCIPNALDAFWV